MTTASPILAGVVGWPIEHSLSPLIHTIWAERAGIAGYYIPFAIPPAYDDFARAMDGLIKLGFKGVNVTLPHKEHALRYAASSSDLAQTAQAANMLTFSAAGPIAENSDIEGFLSVLKENFGQAAPRSPALILGAGGASRGIAIALKQFGFSEIHIANRTRARADAMASKFSLTVVDWNRRNDALPTAGLVVNTTSLGMIGHPSLDLETENLKQETVVADIVYAPLETKLLAAARRRGCRTADGLSMLMHQAAPGFRAWFGGSALVDDDLRANLVIELARRSGK